MQPKRFKCGIDKGTIFNFSIGIGHYRLFIASSRDHKGAKEEALYICGL